MDRLADAPDEKYHQGDERGSEVDFFMPLAARERLHPGFLKIAEDEGFSPARGIIEPMMRWYEDADGNFVQQFQTDGFDARIWELYLFAAFVEIGYSVNRSRSAPDFVCEGMRGTVCVEATTVGPTRDESGKIVPPPSVDEAEGMRAFRNDYMPIKYGSALRSKLLKRYWEREHVAGRPLVFAIHDFQAPMSMLVSRSALPLYLYGYDHEWEHDAEGNLHIYPRKIETHRWGDKVIPSGFFDLPDAENVSAVLFSNSATISRFDRMGVLAGFGSPRVQLIREGFVLNHDPNATDPKFFRKLVRPPGYVENWVEGLEVYHNPRATHPLELAAIPGAAHHRLLRGGHTESITPDFHPLSSVTRVSVVDAEGTPPETRNKEQPGGS